MSTPGPLFSKKLPPNSPGRNVRRALLTDVIRLGIMTAWSYREFVPSSTPMRCGGFG
jgi:hypothetical protein